MKKLSDYLQERRRINDYNEIMEAAKASGTVEVYEIQSRYLDDYYAEPSEDITEDDIMSDLVTDSAPLKYYDFDYFLSQERAEKEFKKGTAKLNGKAIFLNRITVECKKIDSLYESEADEYEGYVIDEEPLDAAAKLAE